MKATDFPNLGPPEHLPHAPRNYQGYLTMKGAEIRRALDQARHPRVDALTQEQSVRFSYQHAVAMTELAKRLEEELGRADARIQTLETIGKARRVALPQERPRTPVEMTKAVANLEELTNDEVYERLKHYRCFGMTTRHAA